MKRIVGLLCLGLLILSGLSSATVAQDNEGSDAPYIYYYSDILNAFVIERADGTDSRLFGDGLAPEDTNSIHGPGWSPSGERFAWTATYFTLGTTTGRVPFVVNANGDRFTGLDDYIDAKMSWSPTDDVLLVVGIKGPFEPVFETPDTSSTDIQMALTIEMIDVAINTVLADFETPHVVTATRWSETLTTIDYPAAIGTNIKWSVDGQHAVVTYDPEPFVPEHVYPENTLYLSRTGETELVVEANTMDRNVPSLGGASGFHAGKTANYINDNRATVVLEDVFAGITYEIAVDNEWICSVLLNPTQNSALLVTKPMDCDDPQACQSDIWLWEPEIESPIVMLSDLPTERILWSPNREYVIIPASPPYLITMNPISVERLDNISVGSHHIWLDDAQIRFIDNTGDSAIAYDVNLTTRSILYTLPEGLGDYEEVYEGGRWSPDGQEFAFVEESLRILNEDFETLHVFRPDGRSWNSITGGEVEWHLDGEWLFVLEDGLVAGGAGPFWSGVAKRDGSVRRDLGSNFNWLPDTVDVSRLPISQETPVLGEPERRISIGVWSTYLSWSPDGTQIVSGETTYMSRGLLLVDVETGAVNTLDEERGNVVRWQENGNGGFAPVTVPLQPRPTSESGRDMLATSANGDYFAADIDDSCCEVGVFERSTEELLFTGIPFGGFPTGVTFSPDGTLVTLSGTHSPVNLYDTATGELIKTLNTNGMAVAFSPDGQTLAVASSWDIQLWDVGTFLENADETSEG